MRLALILRIAENKESLMLAIAISTHCRLDIVVRPYTWKLKSLTQIEFLGTDDNVANTSKSLMEGGKYAHVKSRPIIEIDTVC